jgi:hypothetical protein
VSIRSDSVPLRCAVIFQRPECLNPMLAVFFSSEDTKTAHLLSKGIGDEGMNSELC